MAQKKNASQKSESTVTRIKASDTKPAAINDAPKESIAKAPESTTQKQKKIKKPSAKGIARPFVATGRYFAGAWYELKQVRWPTRRATWGLTAAVLLFTAFFIVVVILLDIGFKYLFDLMLGK
ncbi:preprotein translocase subunit SecE [Candidatus Saccharibacteria bacterium]|nr:preprotein translocase subunit SecE [Candidatus Saccharibacteria bacterium]